MHFSGRTWRPPYERLTPIVEATSGCAWGRCSFCNLYRCERFSIAPIERFCEDLDEVKRMIPYTRRLWLTGGSPFQSALAHEGGAAAPRAARRAGRAGGSGGELLGDGPLELGDELPLLRKGQLHGELRYDVFHGSSFSRLLGRSHDRGSLLFGRAADGTPMSTVV